MNGILIYKLEDCNDEVELSLMRESFDNILKGKDNNFKSFYNRTLATNREVDRIMDYNYSLNSMHGIYLDDIENEYIDYRKISDSKEFEKFIKKETIRDNKYDTHGIFEHSNIDNTRLSNYNDGSPKLSNLGKLYK